MEEITDRDIVGERIDEAIRKAQTDLQVISRRLQKRLIALGCENIRIGTLDVAYDRTIHYYPYRAMLAELQATETAE